MGRLIEESLLQEKLALIPMEERTFRRTVEELENAPTVQAIPKADYEARLKADLVAMLEELKEQLREMHEDFFETEHFDEAYGVSYSMDIIQQKINTLRGGKDAT